MAFIYRALQNQYEFTSIKSEHDDSSITTRAFFLYFYFQTIRVNFNVGI